MRGFHASRTFAAELSSAADARAFVGATLRAWECDRVVDVATLLANELVANAVLHAGTSAAVTIVLTDDSLRVEVSDGNAAMAPSAVPLGSSAGRGLAVVDGLSQAWGVERGGAGKRVWFELPR